MDGLKGIGRAVAVCDTGGSDRIELELFADESWGIRRAGKNIGVWEPHERDECFRVFGMLAGLDQPSTRPHLIVVAPKGTVRWLTTWENVN